MICCPSIYVQSMVAELSSIQVKGIELPLMTFKYDEKNLELLKNDINQFDYVIIPSPAVIDYAKDIIALADKPQFITVGKSSSNKLSQLTGKGAIYPEISSGGAALFNEKLSMLNLAKKKVLVIKGEGGNEELYMQMAKHNIKWVAIDLYKRVFLKLKAGYLKKMLLTKGLDGIIITTGALVEWLFQQAVVANCVDLLKNCLFITIHPQIKSKLVEFGVQKVLLTSRVDKNAVIELIREMYD